MGLSSSSSPGPHRQTGTQDEGQRQGEVCTILGTWLSSLPTPPDWIGGEPVAAPGQDPTPQSQGWDKADPDRTDHLSTVRQRHLEAEPCKHMGNMSARRGRASRLPFPVGPVLAGGLRGAWPFPGAPGRGPASEDRMDAQGHGPTRGVLRGQHCSGVWVGQACSGRFLQTCPDLTGT